MYTCVQALLHPTLRPGLLEALDADKPVKRLLAWVEDQQHWSGQYRRKQSDSATSSETADDNDDVDVSAASSSTELSSADVTPVYEPRGPVLSKKKSAPLKKKKPVEKSTLR